MKKYQKFAISLLALLSMYSCSEETVIKSQTEQTVITLSWWGNDKRNEYTIEAVQKFQKLHPEIKVKCSYSEWSGYESRNRIQMNSDTEADVMQINFNWLSQYSPDGNGYLDLNTVSDIVDLSNFSQDSLSYGTIDGKLNGIPIAMNSETIYVNKTLYDKYGLELPETWDDLFTASEVMKKDGVYAMSGASKSIWLYIMTYAEQVTGKNFLKDDGSLNFTPKDFQVMIDFYVKLVQNDVIPQVEYYERINIENGTYAGTVAWVSDAVNYCGSAIKNGYEITVADYTALSPQKSGEGWEAKPASLYAISNNTDHPTESAMLLDFLLNSQEMALLQGVEKGVPLSTSARTYLEKEDMLNGIQYEASLKMEENKNITQMNPFVENTTAIDRFIDACNLVLYEKADSLTASRKLFSDIKAIS